MFYSLEGYENIKDETKVIYTAEKEYKVSNDDDIKGTEASLTKPFTMLLIGVDSSKDGVTSGYNGDVLLLVTLYISREKIYILKFWIIVFLIVGFYIILFVRIIT